MPIIRSVLVALMFSVSISCTGEVTIVSDLLPLTDWKLQSSAEFSASGEMISTVGFDTEGWYPISVPTTVLAALVDNGVYPEPYYGLNLKSIPGYREGLWLAMSEDSPFYSSWWYRCEFELPAEYEGRRLTLHLDGINYRANIWLNGHQVAGSDEVIGMFRRFTFEIDDWAAVGRTNVLAVETIAPGKIPDVEYRTKQLEATTGWDDHNPQPPDLNMGLWEDVYVSTSGPVTLEHPYVVSDLDLPSTDRARLTLSVYAENKTGEQITGTLLAKIEDVVISQQVTLNAHETKLVTFSPEQFRELNISNPRLWWPYPVGPQELYDLEIEFRTGTVVSDRDSVRFGIREVSTYLNEEGWRGYKINGKDILIRGGAWMTSDMLLRLTRERYEALVRYAREANFNMLRSEGFSIRETDEFYDLCDQYGVMVTQQIFGRSIPDEELALKNVEDMLLRIRIHPSLVHFLGHDETFPTKNLDRAYRALIKKYTPKRTYQPHSGAFDVKERFETGGTRTGTRELWTYATPGHYYTHKDDGAWGFAQSGGIGGVFAPMESMRRMMPEKDIWPPFNETFSFHTVVQGVEYFNALFEALNSRYGRPEDAEDFVRKGLVLNYESARGMFEAYARNKSDALGITTWKYNAAWPAALTWQYIDWYLLPGGAYYGAKKACEPLHVQYSYDDDSIYVVNSYYREFKDLTVTVKVLNIDLTEKLSEVYKIDVGENGKTRVTRIAWPAGLSRSHFLVLSLRNSSGEEVSKNFYWLSTVPDVEGEKGYTRNYQFYVKPRSVADHKALNKLAPVRLQMEYRIDDSDTENVAVVQVSNPTDKLAFFIHVAVHKGEEGLEVAPTYWDDNYFTLLPGESATLHGRFSSKDLGSAQPVVKIDGWNIEKE